MRQSHQPLEANREIWKMVSMGIAGSGWSGLASSFFHGHLDIAVSLTFLETHSSTALAGSAVYVLTICGGRTLLHVKGQGLGSNPSSPICSGTSAEMVSLSAPW